MVFTVTCPECSSEFPVDSAKVPEDGVHAQCSICPEIFLVERPAGPVAEEDSDLSLGQVPDVPEAFDAPEVTEAPEASHMSDAAEVSEVATGGADFAEGPATEHVSAPAAVAEAPSFGQTDPDARAARLARVLVSDMMTYNPAMYGKAMDGGTLVEDFGDEVKRSWSEYVDQVGEDLAKSTPHFTRALNDILAKGEELFDEAMYE